MSLKDKIINRLVDAAISIAPNNKIIGEYHNRQRGKRLGYDRQVVSIQTKTLADWKMALMNATDPDNPTRGQLMRFYLDNLMLDDHLASVIETRSLAVQQASFIVIDKNRKENENLKEKLQREWWLDAIDLHVFSDFQGTTLMEMFDLNPLTGELSKINEIPQSNFCAPKKLFLKKEYDTTGVDFSNPRYYPYYVQIRDDWDMGTLNMLAPIVLAKKLGLGGWLSYIDKFGVPPIFAITDRMDNDRRSELFDMLENFRMNHFAVLQGNERIEIPSNYNVDAYNTFEALHKLGDRCISKRVLGQTGTTDEKSFVGSAQVHEKVAKSRHEADKLRFTYFFNNEIRPRLIKLSSAYSEFENCVIVPDNAENLGVNDFIEGVARLSQYYTFNIQEIAQKTGLPIEGEKQAMPMFQQNPTPEPKKDNNTNADIKPEIIACADDTTNKLDDVLAIDFSGWEKVMQAIADKIYNGDMDASQITPEYVKKLNNTLSDAISRGLDTPLNNIAYNAPDFETIQALQQNIFNFSCAKNFNVQQQINGLLIDENGKRRTLNEFEKQVRELDVEYNRNHLKIEWQTATQNAHAVRDWGYYNDIADVYPNLKIMPTSSKEPREEHKPLEGVILPVTHQFFKTNGLPPYDWGCKHRVEPTKEGATDVPPNVAINPIFAHNVAETGEIFNGKHPYFAMSKSLFDNMQQGTELAKEYADYNTAYKNKGKGKVLNSIFADKKDLKQNFETAKIIADNFNEVVRIRPHINVSGVKNPEYTIKGAFADRKGIKDLKNGVNNAIKKSHHQGCTRTIIDFNQHKVEMDVNTLADKLKGSIYKNRNKNIKEVYITYGDKAVRLTRMDIQSKNLNDILKTLTGE